MRDEDYRCGGCRERFAAGDLRLARTDTEGGWLDALNAIGFCPYCGDPIGDAQVVAPIEEEDQGCETIGSE